jgi:hypothetical protein
MRRRRLLLVGLVAAVLLAGGLFLRLAYPRHDISPEGYERIDVGMTLEEVEAILGGPPGDHTNGRYEAPPYPVRGLAIDPNPPPGVWHDWWGERAAILVKFDLGGRVRDKVILQVEWRRNPSLLDRLRRLFRV